MNSWMKELGLTKFSWAGIVVGLAHLIMETRLRFELDFSNADQSHPLCGRVYIRGNEFFIFLDDCRYIGIYENGGQLYLSLSDHDCYRTKPMPDWSLNTRELYNRCLDELTKPAEPTVEPTTLEEIA